MNPVVQNIRAAASRFNLDPRAMLAIALHEGGLRPRGPVGDNGTSFGPFQMHMGGALPQAHYGDARQWASSRQGIMYAARQMAADGASGKSGRAAISAISRGFERPADPTAEIQDALSHYGGVGGGGINAPTPSPMGGNHGPTVAANPNHQALVSMVMQRNQEFATTGKIDPVLQLSAQQNGLTAQDQAQMGNVRAPSGKALPGRTDLVLKAATHQIGTPYVWGGEQAGKGFDCSGLIQYAYAKAGIHIGRTTYDQIKQGSKVDWGSFKPGDLIFSNFEGGHDPSHVVMYIGHGKVVAAPHTGENVQVENVNLFRSAFVGARRILA